MKKTDRKVWWIYLFALLTAAAAILLIMKGYLPERYNLKVGDICPIDVYASGVITDKLATEKLREDARDYVQAQYRYDLTVSDQVEKDLQKALDQIRELWGKYDEAGSISESDLAASSIQREDWEVLLAMSESELQRFSDGCLAAAEQTMKAGMEEQNADEAYAYLSDALNEESLSPFGRRVAYDLVSALLKPNKTYDPEATQKAKEEAAAKVEPVVFQKGEKIIDRGERVTESDYEMMKEMGYIRQAEFADMTTYSGLFFVILLLLACCAYFFYPLRGELWSRRNSAFAMLTSFWIFLAMLALFVWQSDFSAHLFPLLGLTITAAIICSRRSSIVFHVTVCTVASIALHGDLEYFITCLLGGFLLISLMHKVRTRIRIFLYCIPAALFETALVIFWEMMENNVLVDAVKNGLLMGAGVLISGIVALGVLPLLEAMFHLLTPFQLLEMTNSEHPLLKRLMTEAPGTYHHSLMVGNMAENAAREIGADPLLTRVGAYYHDIGKLKNPIMFRENQLLENPHDDLTPVESAEILLRHPRDGVEIALSYKFPQQLTDFILQHHGTTATLYFYNRAKEQDPDTRIDAFRYAGPRPQAREMAIVMMADSVEAAMRTLKDDSPGAMEEFVDRLIRYKVDDHQLEECDISLSDLQKIKNSFTATLKGYYHKRISYPREDTAQ